MNLTNTLLSIPEGEIHLWFSFHEELGDAYLNERYRRLLSRSELAQQRCFHFARDRHRYLLTRVLVRTVLSRYAPILPEAWEFTINAFGRPEIALGGPIEAIGLDFNLTHTEGLIVLAVTRGGLMGIDAEYTRRPALLGIGDQVFTTSEASALRSLPMSRWPDRFFELWTLKESYVKARGMGLQIPFGHIAFTLGPENHIDVAFDPILDDAPDRWHFWQIRLGSSYLIALCAETSSHVASLTCREVVPLAWERVITLPLTGRTRGIGSHHDVSGDG